MENELNVQDVKPSLRVVSWGAKKRHALVPKSTSIESLTGFEFDLGPPAEVSWG